MYTSATEYLARLVSIDSTQGKEADIADFVEGQLLRLGFTIEPQKEPKDRRNILASRGSNPKLCCYGHLDTVPVYKGWLTDPFELTHVEDKLYGLGANDMKGGIAALLAAVERLPRALPLKLLFCYDEEYDSAGAWRAVKEQLDWFHGVTHLLSVEPGTAVEDTSVRPTITLGRRGRARYIVDITGYSAHGGNSHRGISAVYMASALIPRLEHAPICQHPKLGSGSQFVASISSQTQGLSVPDYCRLEIERHFVIGETVSDILADYQRIADEVKEETLNSLGPNNQVAIQVALKPRENPYMEPFVVSRKDIFVQLCSERLQNRLGDYSVTYGQSVADDNIFANTLGLGVVVLGPNGGNEHSPNEWVSSTSLNEYSEVYESILREYKK